MNHRRGTPLASWLADLPDERLIRLLELRGDLAQPPPGSIAALAARAQARQSIKAAADDLDFLHLAVLDALLVLNADTAPVPLSELVALVEVPEPETRAAVADLSARALVWGDGELRVAADAGAALPWHPGQVTMEDTSRSGAQLTELIDALDAGQRELLDRLAYTSPLGRTRDAAPDTPPERPVPRLLAAGLLRRLDQETVILPRQVGMVLRGENPGPTALRAPDPVVATLRVDDVDAAAAGAALDLLRELEVLLEELGTAPVTELRAGGLGVRELKRLAKSTGLTETRLGLLLQLAKAAALIHVGQPEPADGLRGDGPYWAPTAAADRFLETSAAQRWQLLAGTWLDLPARPGLIGTRGPDNKAYGALSHALYSTAAPLDRRLLLRMLADLPPGAAVNADSAAAALIWRRPRWPGRLQPGPVANLLEEAHALGLVGRGALSSPARVLLDGSAEAAVAEAMRRALPAPLDHFLVQADLTVVVPGPLERELAAELAAVAAVESAGAAMVYRVSETTIRHALDIGRSAAALHAFFARHSKTPVPQGLTYLIDDVSRRHGQLRVGMATSFVRCEDATLLAQAVAVAEPLGLRTLAPTVAVSQAPIGELLAVLRGAGLVPAAEDAAGTIVDLSRRAARVEMPVARRAHPQYPPVPTATVNLGALVAVLRKVTALPLEDGRVEPVTARILLQHAADQQLTVMIGYVDPAGVATQRVVSPIAVHGGQLVAYDSASGRLREFTIHRVTSVMRADDDAEDVQR